MHLGAVLDVEVDAMDVDQAFLQGELAEGSFVEPPQGLQKPLEDTVWKLKKPLYGLKQAPR